MAHLSERGTRGEIIHPTPTSPRVAPGGTFSFAIWAAEPGSVAVRARLDHGGGTYVEGGTVTFVDAGLDHARAACEAAGGTIVPTGSSTR